MRLLQRFGLGAIRAYGVLVLPACVVAFSGVAVAGGGVVEVSFVDTPHFVDAGETRSEQERNLQVLADYMTQLGALRLPAGATLRVDVLDVDLAGTVKHNRPAGDLRVVKGNADWPRMTVRYSLRQDGKIALNGQDDLADMGYLNHATGRSQSEPLSYEKRMLDQWFARRFGLQISAKD